MNKLLTKIVGAALGLSMTVGVGVAVASQTNKGVAKANAAEEVYYTLSPSSTGSNSYDGNGDATISGITWNVEGNGTTNPWRIGGKSKTNQDRSVTSKTAMGSAITKVELSIGAADSITVNSLKLIVASNSTFSTVIDEVSENFSDNSTITFTPTGSATEWATGSFYKFLFNVTISATKNKFLEFSGADFYRNASASSKYTVTYDLNGGTGTSNIPEDNNEYSSGATVTVLGIGDVTKTGYSFVNWSDGTNTYVENDTFTITANTTLTAQWYHDDVISVVSGKEANTIYTGATLDLSHCVTAVGDGALSFTVPSVNYLTYDSTTTTVTADSTNTGGPLTVTAYKGTAHCSFTITVAARPATGTFELFSGSFEAGTYVIASGTSAMQAEISNKRGAYTTITPNANNEVVNPASDLIWEIEEATIGEKTGYTIFNSDAGYFSSTTSDGNAALLETATSKSIWAASGDGSYEFVNQDPKTSTKANLRLNSGYGFACYATSTGSALTLYKLHEAEKPITDSRMVNGTVSASTGDTEWKLSGFKFFVTYEGESETEVTDKTTFNVAEAVPTINADGSMNVTVTPTFKNVVYTAKAAVVSATLTFIDPYSIARLYDIELALNGTEDDVTFDGIYMGESGGGFIVMNGAYGMMVYGSHSEVSDYTAGETYLTVTGTLKNYNYLYEINNDSDLSFGVLTDATRKSHVGTPSTYVVNGSETNQLYLANRKTSLSGTVSSMQYSYKDGNNTIYEDTDALEPDKNNSVQVSVGGNDILLYIKAADASSNLVDDIYTGAQITVEGFTTFYKSNSAPKFEVMFTSLVEADASYHAADFAKDLLKLTRTICATSDEGNGSALTSVWTTLAGHDYWLKVEANGEASTLVNGTPSSSIVVPNTDAGIDAMSDADAIAAALYRYDWCTAKYHLTNFMERELTVSFGSRVIVSNNASYTAPIVAIVSVITLSAVAGYFMLRKRKEQ